MGVCLDQTLSLRSHITKKCQIAMLNIQRLKQIRYSLTTDVCKCLVQCLVLSHLDYANAILVGLPKCDINKIQKIQNIAAKLILGRSFRDSATQALKDLHWLPINARIDFKISLLIFKCLNHTAPNYLIDLIKPKLTKRPGLRSNDNGIFLITPYTKRKTFAERSFSVYGPKLWNSLPIKVRSSSNITNFRKCLKTYLFIREFEQ